MKKDTELLRNYLAGINDKIQIVQFLTSQSAQNPLVQSDEAQLENYKLQSGAVLDLLALSTNLNYYFNTFSYSDSDGGIDVFKTLDELIKKCNELLGRAVVAFNAEKSMRFAKISERVFTVAFLNLIQNALLYSEPGSKIKVKLLCDNDNAVISIANEIAVNPAPASGSIRLGVGLPLAEKIVSGVGGEFISGQAEGVYEVRMTLPLCKEMKPKCDAVGFITQNEGYVKRYLSQFIET
jgi:two-component sensor histidine kinase